MKKSVLFLFVLAGQVLLAQNVYEISCTAFSKGRELSNVTYQLTMNNEIVATDKSKSGSYSFIILPNDGHIVVEVTKPDYVPKIIHLRTDRYPFENEFEIQEIDLEFEWSENSRDSVQIGELIWSDLANTFNVIKVDSALMKVKSEYERSEKKLGRIYSRSVEDGDELLAIGQPAMARRHFEIALLAKPGDTYASRKMADIQKMESETMAVEKKVFESEGSGVSKDLMEKINRGEVAEVTDVSIDKNVIYRVQLGAFSKDFDPEKFKNVPEFTQIPYEDFTRCFSGEFLDVNLAINRRKEMIAQGFKDAWIVKMRGNERIGF